MPSFLNKVFGRNKDDKESPKQAKRDSVQSSLLEGKFEAVSPSVSPSAAEFAEGAQEKAKSKQKEREKEGGFPAIFRTKSRQTSPTRESPNHVDNAPHLSLNLPGFGDERSSRPLGSVFNADPASRTTLSEAVIGEKRLSPSETLLLVRTCSRAIVDRGLETLGVMHPHWYSASPETQRRLISLFIHSLKTPDNSSDFESEVQYIRSPHDIAAVLRWGLRHLKLEGSSFGKDPSWYSTFSEAEKGASYPADAYSTKLVPLLPSPHADLLSATLDIVSSLAAHGEANGVSGSKLAKLLGLWLLTAKRAEEMDDWKQFYARWEWAGRALEHLFLAKIRDETLKQRMPKRLTELVTHYPYDKSADGMLARPRFSTRKSDALFVRIEVEVPRNGTPKVRQHPLRIVNDALHSESGHTTADEDDAVWTAIRSRAQAGEAERLLSNVFADDTVRLLSLVPDDMEDKPTSDSSSTLLTPPPVIRVNEPGSRARAASAGDQTNGHAKSTSGSTSRAHQVYGGSGATDWAQFSTSGFGESSGAPRLALTLLDKDLEVTHPNPPKRKASSKRKSSPPGTAAALPSPSTPAATSPAKPPRSTLVSAVQLDEAFVDFWSDALTDPISGEWPNFVVCQLKSNISDFKTVQWLIIEEALVHPPEPVPAPQPRPSSPRPSTQSRKSAAFSIGKGKKKFSLFGNRESEQGVSGTKRGKAGKGTGGRVGEMGEVLSEEAERGDGRSAGVAAAAAGATPAVAAAAAAAGTKDEEKEVASPVSEPEEMKTPGVEEEDATPVTTATDVPQSPLSVEAQSSPLSGESVDKVHTSPAVLVPVDSTGKALPPAPEPVVTSGATPGPQLALATSEPVAAATVSDEVEVQPTYVEISPASEEASTPQTVPEPRDILPEPPATVEEPVTAEDPTTAQGHVAVREGAPVVDVTKTVSDDAEPGHLRDHTRDVSEPSVPPARAREHPAPQAKEEPATTASDEKADDVPEAPGAPAASEQAPFSAIPTTVVPGTTEPYETVSDQGEEESEAIAKAPSTEDIIGRQPSPEDSNDMPTLPKHVVPEARGTEVIPSTFDNEILERGSRASSIARE
ncbi:hypothetical protein OE88DRAFT_1728626 [Heliocybe sulcata]|uniref:Rho-GAP domain-containing protein n=1 Tax=Heliocybe sulcata TaxID=5364 RepID=A0A5C3MTQ7_9AGAM|nr:hypothetical protein OE88DRAFT_1728626 [Heliocybe sulcata]